MEEKKILDANDMMLILNTSRASLDRWEKAGKIPKRIYLGARSVGWVKEEVDAWIEERKKARYSCNMKK